MKRLLVFVSAVVVAATVVAVGSATPTQRSGALHVTKDCSQYFGHAGEFCTIKSSNIDQIKPGMRVFYLKALAADGTLDSPIVLAGGNSDVAFGHVVLNATTMQVTFFAGIGVFAGFHASVIVSQDSTGLWHWDGTYSFRGRPWADAN